MARGPSSSSSSSPPSTSPYQPAASILNKIWEQHTSLKSVVYRNGKLGCYTTTYAQVCKVLSHQRQIDRILEQVAVVDDVRNKGLLYVLLYELLFGPHKAIKGGGALKRQILRKEKELRLVAEDLLADGDDKDDATTLRFPRYVRVNTLTTTTKEVVSILMSGGVQVYRDAHIPDLLVVHPDDTKKLLATDTLKGKIVLQDKSSCFSAYCMVEGFASEPFDTKAVDYLDACAAPGNKTTHLAALLAGRQRGLMGRSDNDTESKRRRPPTTQSTIYAFDRSDARIKLLRRRVKEISGGCSTAPHHAVIEPRHQDFLSAKPKDYPSVGAILLDPSCSGSGIYTSGAGHQQDEGDGADLEKRLDSLASFQLKALRHAISFANVNQIVYSTCSIHTKENEHVVAQALEGQRDDWQVIAPKCLADWQRRGEVVSSSDYHLTKDEAACMIRVDRDDATNGFFVGCLQRKRGEARMAENGVRSTRLASANQVDLEVYRGQFDLRSRKSVSGCKNEFEEDKDVWKSQGGSATSKPTPAVERRQSRKRHGGVSDATAVSRKRLKKLAWKQNQRQKKLERLARKENAQTTAS